MNTTRSPLPKIGDGHQDAYQPPVNTWADVRAQQDELERQAKDKRCQICRNPITVPIRYIQEENRREAYLRCTCYPDEPQPFRPETGMEFYERTGTGDTVSIMQVERQRAKRIKRAKERMPEMNSTEMVLFKTPEGEEVGLDIRTVKEMFCEKATDAEATLFLRVCQFQGMNPFLRDAYLIKYDENKPASIVIGKGFYEQRAGADPAFAGMEAGIIVERRGDQLDLKGTMKQNGDELVGGWAIAHRRDRKVPTEIRVSLDEYSKNQSTWKQIPATMIRKVALVQALREAFPTRFHQIPTMDNMPVIDEEELPFQVEGEVIASSIVPEGVDRETGEILSVAAEGPGSETRAREETKQETDSWVGETAQEESVKEEAPDPIEGSAYEDWRVSCPIHSELWKDESRFGRSHFLTEEQQTAENQRGCYFKTVTSQEARRLLGNGMKDWMAEHRNKRLWSDLNPAEQLTALVELRGLAEAEAVAQGAATP